MPRPALSLALLVLALACVACAWSVPADPGENARRRTPHRPGAAPVAALPLGPRAPAGDPATRALYERKCGECHAPFPPTFATAEEWPVFVRRYGPRAGLFGAERQRVLAWLRGNAAR